MPPTTSTNPTDLNTPNTPANTEVTAGKQDNPVSEPIGMPPSEPEAPQGVSTPEVVNSTTPENPSNPPSPEATGGQVRLKIEENLENIPLEPTDSQANPASNGTGPIEPMETTESSPKSEAPKMPEPQTAHLPGI